MLLRPLRRGGHFHVVVLVLRHATDDRVVAVLAIARVRGGNEGPVTHLLQHLVYDRTCRIKLKRWVGDNLVLPPIGRKAILEARHRLPENRLDCGRVERGLQAAAAIERHVLLLAREA